MLLGYESISKGQVSTKNGLRIGYLAQNTGLHSNQTIQQEMESVFADLIQKARQMRKLELQMGSEAVINNPLKLHKITKIYDQIQNQFNQRHGYGFRAEIRGVLSGFGFKPQDYHRNINDLSGGQQSQLALAKLLLEKKDLLILDEPTNHIDVRTLTWLENYLQGYPGALLVISHDRYFLDKIAHEVYYLASGSLTHYYGNYTQFTRKKKKRYWLQLRSYQRQQSKIHKTQEFIKKNIARASTSRRAKSRRRQLAKVKLIHKPRGTSKVARLRFQAERASGSVVLTVHNLAIGYHKIISSPINLDIKRSQVIAIIGPNGIGKSTLLKTILGIIPKIKGTIQFGTGVSVGYYDQKQATLHPQKTVLDEVWDDHPNTDEEKIRSILGSFLFSGEEVNKQVSQLSGGEKARLQLTKLSMTKSNFLLLDEPTNHLDIASREVLENALKNFAGTILFVSHDRYFINKIATEVVEISKNGSKTYLGNYNYYINKKAEEKAIQARKAEKLQKVSKRPIQQHKIPKTKAHAKKIYQINKQQKHAKQKLQRTIQQLEKQITKLDQKKNQTELQMAHHASDVKKIIKWQHQLKTIEQKDQELTSQWEDKAIQLEKKF